MLHSTSRFAALAGVTIRTLRFYDKAGLLHPTAVTESGHRRYSDQDLIRLQQILVLKFLGFSLDQIREMLAGGGPDFRGSLAVQKRMLEEQRARVETVLRAIDDFDRLLALRQEMDWEKLAWVIKVIHMEDGRDRWKQYFSEEARRKLESRPYTQEQAWADAKRWEEVIAGMKAAFARGAGPTEPSVQDLARRWQGLVEEFTQGDPEILAGLQRSHAEPSPGFQKPLTDEEEAFVNRALDILRQG